MTSLVSRSSLSRLTVSDRRRGDLSLPDKAGVSATAEAVAEHAAQGRRQRQSHHLGGDLLSAVTGGFFWLFPHGHMLWVFAAALLVRMALNTLDGMMARIHGMKSVEGEMLNELGDVVSDAVMYLPLVKLPGVNSGWVLWFIFLALLNEFIGLLTKAATGVRRYDGPMGKSYRALVLGLTCLLFFFWPAVKVSFDYIFSGMSVLLVVSSIARVRSGLASKSQCDR